MDKSLACASLSSTFPEFEGIRFSEEISPSHARSNAQTPRLQRSEVILKNHTGIKQNCTVLFRGTKSHLCAFHGSKWCEMSRCVLQFGGLSTLWEMKKNVPPKLFTKTGPLRVKSQLQEDVTIDNSTVFVVGGGGIGMEVVRNLAKVGSWVTVFQRGEKFRSEIESLGAMLAIGDVMNPSTIEKALTFNTFDAIVCTVGGGTKNPEVDQDGCINVMHAAKKAGVKRFLMVSSIGVGDSVIAVTEQTLKVLKVVLDAKGVAEKELKSSGLVYTIVRPGGLLSEPPSGRGVFTEDPSIAGLIARGDVASLIMQVLFKKQAEFKTFSAIDSERLFPPTTSLEGVELVSLS